MKPTELHHWRVTDRVSGRRYVTRYPMSEASARDFDPMAERVSAACEPSGRAPVAAPQIARERQASPA
jgi:hypothetical protein